MVLRIAGLPVWPTDMITGVRSVLGWTEEAVGVVAALPERISGLLDDIDTLMARINAVVDNVDGVISRADEVTAGATGIVREASNVTSLAAGVIAEAGAASTSATDLLATFVPIAEQAAPLARRFVEEFSEDEISAAIRLIDQLPQLTEHVETDIMPILATLDRVGPDMHELLEVVKDVRLALGGIPGLRLLRRLRDREEGNEPN